MSGIVSGIGKVFSTVTSGVARVGKAIMGVGATTFTAGAATGAAPLASGGLAGIVQNFTGTSTLGKIGSAIACASPGAIVTISPETPLGLHGSDSRACVCPSSSADRPTIPGVIVSTLVPSA